MPFTRDPESPRRQVAKKKRKLNAEAAEVSRGSCLEFDF